MTHTMTMALDKYVGKKFTHKDLGKVRVDSKVERSRTQLNVTILERGKGWDERTKSYKGHKNSVGWMRGENREYLSKDIVHKKDLSE